MRHKHWFLIILALVAAAVYVVVTMPVKRGLDLKGGMRVILRANSPDGKRLTPGLLNDAKNVIQRRVDSLGVSEPLVQTKGDDQIVVELPDVKPEQKTAALKQFEQLALLRFVRVPEEKYEVQQGPEDKPVFLDKVTRQDVPADVVIDYSLANGGEIVSGRDLLPGKARSNVGQDGQPLVELHFNSSGRKKFADFTLRNVKKHFAIYLDKDPISAPIIEEPIPGGDGIIHGGFASMREAQDLADLLNAGALPVPLKVEGSNEVGPTLGRESVHASLLAGIVGLSLVILFMVLYYRLPGLVAVVALSFYTIFTFALFKIIPVTLTLPGIAGFILSIGMAVDANILIFERLKEELNLGKTLRAAIDAGFSRAFPSILDSNACTLITCFFLGNFGSGPVKGFAFVLALGVVVSMFTAITCTRTMLYMLVGSGMSQNPTLWGLGTSWLHRPEGQELKVIEHSKTYFLISGAIILPGILFMGLMMVRNHSLSPINKGIDFTGGTIMELRYTKDVPSTGAVSAVMEKAGASGATVSRSGSLLTIRSKPITTDERVKVDAELKALNPNYVVESSDTVGPVMGKELTRGAILSVLFASIAIILYLALRFSGFDFGVTAVIALLHDVLVLLGLFAIGGYLMHWEVDSLFVTAALTVIGFSVHDTIVVFDRIRENLRYRQRGESFDLVANRSISQTLARSINTSATVVMVLTALVILGGGSIREFNIAMLIGIVSGTYSSIFNATPLLAIWRRMQREQAQSAARRPEEKAMITGPQRPKAAAPKPAPRPAAVLADADDEDGMERSPLVTAGGISKAAPKPQRNIKRKKRRF